MVRLQESKAMGRIFSLVQDDATLDGEAAKLRQPAMTAKVQTVRSWLCSKAATLVSPQYSSKVTHLKSFDSEAARWAEHRRCWLLGKARFYHDGGEVAKGWIELLRRRLLGNYGISYDDYKRWPAPLSPAREVIFFYFAIFHYVVRSFSRFASASPYSLTYGISRTPNNFLVPQLRAENHHKRPTVFSYPSSTLRSISLYFLSPCLNFRAALGCHRGRIGLDSLMWPSGVLGLAHELGMAAMFMNEWVLSGGLIKDGVHISAKQHSEGYVFIGE